MGADRASLRAIWMLAAGQMLAYACFFYLFAALILYWRSGLHFGDGLLAGGLTLAIVIAAGLAPFAGRAVDRGLAAPLLAGGAVAGGLSLLLLATATTPAVYLLAWAGLGLAQGACLYEPCFALMIRRFGPEARSAITRVTLVGGFASTLAFPVLALLAEGLGWRGAVLGAAAVALCVVAPLNLFGARWLEGGVPPAAPQTVFAPMDWRQRFRHWPFLRLALLFSLLALNHWMILAFLRPAFAAMGVTDALAVAAAATVGPAQVAGRLVLMAAGLRLSGRRAMTLTLLGFVAAPLAMALAGVAMPMVFAFALLQGAANGVLTILRPLLVAEDLGAEGFGAISGLMSIPTLAASAVAPLLGAGLMALGGWPALTGVAAVLALTALLLARWPGAARG